jgi:hypothetical protein
MPMPVSAKIRLLGHMFAIGTLVVVSNAQANPTRAYKVELVLFEQLSTSSEQFIERSNKHENWPDLENAVELSTKATPDGYFYLLPPMDRDLSSSVARLNKSSHYHVITHIAWKQPGLDDAAAKSVHIHGGKHYETQFPERLTPPNTHADETQAVIKSKPPVTLEQVDGTVKIVLARYLHVYTDLIFRKPVTTEYEYSDGQVFQSTFLRDVKVRTRRRMRSRELHYLDHPLLGILVQITPIEVKTTAAEMQHLTDETLNEVVDQLTLQR